jgi:aryl-alcohol dehydrogenase-like predicted oxidoreductase
MAELALGTVQLGLPYGAANSTGMPTEEEAVAIVREAVAGGVRELDTAHGYVKSATRMHEVMN